MVYATSYPGSVDFVARKLDEIQKEEAGERYSHVIQEAEETADEHQEDDGDSNP